MNAPFSAEITHACTVLAAVRQSLTVPDLLAMEAPAPEFEQHFPLENAWLYTINGKTLNGNSLIVRARLPIQAETLAHEVLAALIAEERSDRENTGITTEVVIREAQH